MIFINLILNIKTSALKDENIDKAFKYMIDLIEKDENNSNSDDTNNQANKCCWKIEQKFICKLSIIV